MNTRNGNLVNLVTMALLMALIFLMGQTPLGLIPLGFCNVTPVSYTHLTLPTSFTV